jgi:hypothetical protein
MKSEGMAMPMKMTARERVIGKEGAILFEAHNQRMIERFVD